MYPHSKNPHDVKVKHQMYMYTARAALQAEHAVLPRGQKGCGPPPTPVWRRNIIRSGSPRPPPNCKKPYKSECLWESRRTKHCTPYGFRLIKCVKYFKLQGFKQPRLRKPCQTYGLQLLIHKIPSWDLNAQPNLTKQKVMRAKLHKAPHRTNHQTSHGTMNNMTYITINDRDSME